MPLLDQNIKMDNIKLVLLSCCAPCSAGAILQLANGDFPTVTDFVVLFYNPNIYPDDEYQKRLSEQIKYCDSLGVKYHVGSYDHAAWLDQIRGHEDQPERGSRCAKCFAHRFRYAQNWAIENGYNAIASVLGVSRHKDQGQVDACATDTLSEIKYLKLDWDESLRQQANRQSDFYRQNYCGCEFSIRK